jgi:hypothetical protein
MPGLRRRSSSYLLPAIGFGSEPAMSSLLIHHGEGANRRVGMRFPAIGMWKRPSLEQAAMRRHRSLLQGGSSLML